MAAELHASCTVYSRRGGTPGYCTPRPDLPGLRVGGAPGPTRAAHARRMSALQRMEMERVGATVSLHGRAPGAEVAELTPLESFTFDVSGYIIARQVFTQEQLRAGLLTLAEHKTVMGLVQQLCGEAHLPGPPAPPVLDVAPALLTSTGPALQGYSQAVHSRGYVSLPRDGSMTQNTRWSCLCVRVFFAVGHSSSRGELVLLPGSHRSTFAPPERVVNGRDDELLYEPSLRPGDVLLTAGTTLWSLRHSDGTSVAMCEYVSGGSASHIGGEQLRPSLTGSELPAWVSKLSPVQRQLCGWGDPSEMVVSNGDQVWLEPRNSEGSQSLLVEDMRSVGVDPRDLYFWDVRGYLVLRGCMDQAWLADANDAIDAATSAEQKQSATVATPVLQPYLTARWDDLQPEHQAAASVLGWQDALSWETAAVTAACEMEWLSLSSDQRAAAACLGFNKSTWPRQAAYRPTSQPSFAHLGMPRLGAPMQGTASHVLGNLLELPCQTALAAGREHPFARMISHPALLQRIQWMMGPGFEAHNQVSTVVCLNRTAVCGSRVSSASVPCAWCYVCAVTWLQPRAVLSTRGTQGHLLHGMIEGPEGRIETLGPLGRPYCPLINVAYQLRDAREEDGGFCLVPGAHKSVLGPGAWPVS